MPDGTRFVKMSSEDDHKEKVFLPVIDRLPTV